MFKLLIESKIYAGKFSSQLYWYQFAVTLLNSTSLLWIYPTVDQSRIHPIINNIWTRGWGNTIMKKWQEIKLICGISPLKPMGIHPLTLPRSHRYKMIYKIEHENHSLWLRSILKRICYSSISQRHIIKHVHYWWTVVSFEQRHRGKRFDSSLRTLKTPSYVQEMPTDLCCFDITFSSHYKFDRACGNGTMRTLGC